MEASGGCSLTCCPYANPWILAQGWVCLQEGNLFLLGTELLLNAVVCPGAAARLSCFSRSSWLCPTLWHSRIRVSSFCRSSEKVSGEQWRREGGRWFVLSLNGDGSSYRAHSQYTLAFAKWGDLIKLFRVPPAGPTLWHPGPSIRKEEFACRIHCPRKRGYWHVHLVSSPAALVLILVSAFDEPERGN